MTEFKLGENYPCVEKRNARHMFSVIRSYTDWKWKYGTFSIYTLKENTRKRRLITKLWLSSSKAGSLNLMAMSEL